MARPKLPDEELKHPRMKFVSKTTGEQLDIPEPSKKEKKKWEPLVNLCIRALLMNDKVDNKGTKAAVRLLLPEGWKSTGKLPPCPIPGKKIRVVEINAEIILLWLWKHKLAPNNPSMIYAANRYFTTRARAMENFVDNLEDFI